MDNLTNNSVNIYYINETELNLNNVKVTFEKTANYKTATTMELFDEEIEPYASIKQIINY